MGIRALACGSICLLAWATAAACGEPTRTELRHDGEHWQLLRGGQPYFICGAGGDGPKPLLAKVGGNSYRTWGADDLGPKLDEAQRLGLSVTVGIWLGQERQGFKYDDPAQRRRQLERVRAAVAKYKGHSAVLMWAVGNETEGYKATTNPAVWAGVNEAAEACHALDPDHPVMTVVAEVGGDRVASVERLCPAVDVLGINSYGGGASLARRYRKAGGTKPFVVTEYGPAGAWEVGRTPWKTPVEPTSTEKAAAFRATYEGSISAERGRLCLGSYAFTWGHKQEATATWFGLLLPDGDTVAAVDTLSELWTGKSVEHPAPAIRPLRVSAAKAKPGTLVHVDLDVTSADPLAVTWELRPEAGGHGVGGDAEAAQPLVDGAINHGGTRGADVTLPAAGGAYWLYATARDRHGKAATADVSLYVDAPVAKYVPSPATRAAVPCDVYADGPASRPWSPSGYMGDTAGIVMDDRCTTNPHAGATCLKVEFRSAQGWGGVAWQDPPNDWGDRAGGRDLTGATKLTFWARGDAGGERVGFAVGLLGHDKAYPDSCVAKLPDVTLTAAWTQYAIDLTGKNLTRIKTPFAWTVAAQAKGITFYLDDVGFE